jgi:hypothetical protein
MIDTQKTRLMTKCAIYEKHEGAEDIDISKYFKADYVRLGLLKTIVSVTVGYFLLVLLYVLLKLDYFAENIPEMDIKGLALGILAAYAVTLAFYLIAVRAYLSIKYVRSRTRLAEYYKDLGRINKLNEEEPPVKDLSGAEYDTTT